MKGLNPTKRFSIRAKNYVKYRPSYSTAVYDCLRDECGLTKTAVIADIGSGTGLFAELFLKRGNPVLGVEPNQEMREAGEDYLSGYANFTSINGTAENTTLADQSVDFITAGQAAHWFDFHPARQEFERIIKPNGVIALCWNQFNLSSSAFMQEYDQLFNRFSTMKAQPEQDPSILPNVLLKEGYQRRSFPNPRSIDLETFKGGVLSSSVMPLDNPDLVPAIDALFKKHEQNGLVQFINKSNLFFNRVT